MRVRFPLLILLCATAVVSAQSITSDAPVVSQDSPPKQAASAISFGSDGLLFSTADKAYELRVHGYVQADDRMFSSNIHGEPLDTFLFRRIRPVFEGTLFNAVDFRFMPDFGENNPQIQDVYLELKSVSLAKLRVGKFKEPIGLEALRSDRELTFPERSLASDLVPLRYMGVQVSGSIGSESIAYEVGYFNGSNDGSNGSFQWVQANEGAARVFLRPFATTNVKALRNFGFGTGASFGAQHGPIAGLKTTGQSTFFKYSSTALADGQHNRIAPQAYYYAGPFGIMGEYVISSQEVLNKNATRRLRNGAWQTAASVVLTGESNGYNGVRPRHNFGWKRPWHVGAVELAIRYSQLDIDPDAFPLFANPKTAAQRVREQGIGVNWHLNQYLKLVTIYEHTTFKMAPGVITPLQNEDVLMSRIQLAF